MNKKQIQKATDRKKKKCCYFKMFFNIVLSNEQRDWSLSLLHFLNISLIAYEDYIR